MADDDETLDFGEMGMLDEDAFQADAPLGDDVPAGDEDMFGIKPDDGPIEPDDDAAVEAATEKPQGRWNLARIALAVVVWGIMLGGFCTAALGIVQLALFLFATPIFGGMVLLFTLFAIIPGVVVGLFGLEMWQGVKNDAQWDVERDRLKEPSTYDMLATFGFVILVVGILCLFLQWKAYHYDTWANEAKKGVAAVTVVQSGPANTIAVA